MGKGRAEFANFICRFGEHVLLDYAEEIVLPAFLDDALIRSYGREHPTHYHFLDVKLERAPENPETLLLSGQFVKDTALWREQIFAEGKGLVHDEASMRSAPSAFFVLILNNHRLIYMPETAYAPTLDEFRSTVSYFMRKKYRMFVDQKIAERGGDETERPRVLKEFAAPSLKIVPLPSRDSIEDFVSRYSVLKRIEFKVLDTNDDIDGSELLAGVRGFGEAVGADKAVLAADTSAKEGLDKGKSAEIIHEASAAGNHAVRLRGWDQEGNKLDGSNEEFRVSVGVGEVPASRRSKLRLLVSLFFNLLTNGTIKVDSSAVDNSAKIDRLAAALD